MSSTAAWAGIASIVVTATAGDVLQARAMKEIGDLGAIRRSGGMLQVVGAWSPVRALCWACCSWRWHSSAC